MYRHFIIVVHKCTHALTFIHNIDGHADYHTNLTNVLQNYFHIVGIPGRSVRDQAFADVDDIVVNAGTCVVHPTSKCCYITDERNIVVGNLPCAIDAIDQLD